MDPHVKLERHEIRVAGKTVYVPSVKVCGQTIVATGNWLRVARIKDEELVEGRIVGYPAAFVEGIRQSQLPADVFTFAQELPETTPRYGFYFYWVNRAVLPITSYKDWWEEKVPHQTRTNVRRAAKCGVTVRREEFGDEFVRGIQAIYNETRIRQGKPFWHFGKDFDTVKRESATYLERSEFLGAYLNDEPIGFLKIIYVDGVAMIIHILSKAAHKANGPTNALIAKAVEACERKGLSFLIYGNYDYAGGGNSSLTEFKRRNGFEEMKFPRYFCPLTAMGKLAAAMGLLEGVKGAIPLPVTSLMKRLRAEFYSRREQRRQGRAVGESLNNQKHAANK